VGAGEEAIVGGEDAGKGEGAESEGFVSRVGMGRGVDGRGGEGLRASCRARGERRSLTSSVAWEREVRRRCTGGDDASVSIVCEGKWR
jgi:hypothetical protein